MLSDIDARKIFCIECVCVCIVYIYILLLVYYLSIINVVSFLF
jgi:hypothetical protein